MSIHVMSWVWKHSKAQGVDKLVLLKIADSADDDGGNAWPSVETIATECGVDRRTVQRIRDNLIELGELRVETNAGGPKDRPERYRPNRYTVIMEGRQNATQSPDQGRQPGRSGAATTTSRGGTQPHNPSLPIQEPPNVDPDSFELIWSTYPRKVNKAGARAKYQARVNNGADPAEMQRAVENYAAHCKREQTDEKFILHGQTFFGPNERWRDWIPTGEDDGKFYDEDGNEISESAWAAQRNGEFMRSEEAKRWA